LTTCTPDLYSVSETPTLTQRNPEPVYRQNSRSVAAVQAEDDPLIPAGLIIGISRESI
jgi:hypothetical protein